MTDGLLVDRTELLNALTTIRRFSKTRGKTNAYLYFELGELKIQAGKTRVSVKGKGGWPHAVAVNAVMLGRASLDLPKTDPILLQPVGDRLHIGSLSITAHKATRIPDFIGATPAQKATTTTKPKESPKRDALNLPPNSSSKHVLKATLGLTPEEIAMKGLTARHEQAMMDRNRRISAAVKELSIYGVKHADLADLVNTSLKRQKDEG